MYLPKHMVVGYAMESSKSLMIASSPLHHQPLIKPSKSLNHSKLRNEHSSNPKAEPNTALSEALHAKRHDVHNLVEAVYYEPRRDQELKIDEHVHQ